MAGLLKADPKDVNRLIYAGEALLNRWHLDDVSRELVFEIDGSDAQIKVGALIPPLLIADMDVMMYALKVDVSVQYNDMEIVGFGKNEESKNYLLFVRI